MLLLEIAEGETTFAEAGLGELSAEAGVPEDEPRLRLSADCRSARIGPAD